MSSSKPVLVLDYGIGNLLNVVRALRACGGEVQVVERASDVAQLPERMVLPGVGAFIDGMQELRRRGFDELVTRFAATQRPFLGICVGAQMLFEVGEEFEAHPGLGLIPGRVQAVPTLGTDGKAHRIPHIGWSSLHLPSAQHSWQGSLLHGQDAGVPAYFVHSFAPVPTHEAHRLADTYYNGTRICAAVKKDNLMGCQFHPERSAAMGLTALRKFFAL